MSAEDTAALDAATQFFFELTPERILDSAEAAGLRCTGRCLALNSMENRVYEVEIEVEDESTITSRFDLFRVVKFYRPGRWTKEQILEEHSFLAELERADIPVAAPLPFEDGSTLKLVEGSNIWCSVFPKIGGRSPDEPGIEELERIGRLLARLHNVGQARPAANRLRLTPELYGIANMRFLYDQGFLPEEMKDSYKRLVESICAIVEPWFKEVDYQRIHGDCHFGNILWNTHGPCLLDFDDMVMGPCVQDLWLILPGRDEETKRQLQVLLAAYESMRSFDRGSLRLIEPLRALRFIHYSAWIARRWQDPAFQRVFTHFGSPGYWNGQLADLREQLMYIQEGSGLA
jgi:Ser/Thr protein kinase RdoA (MazF antagonist)